LEVTIHTLSDVRQEAEILLTNDELQPHFDMAYEKERARIEIKGFRKGKAPLPMIKKLYGEAIEQDSLDTIASEYYRKAMVEREVRPIGQPEMVDIDFRRGEGFRFRIRYEVRPAIELHTYKGIAVERPVHTVTDEEVNAEIERLRRMNSTTSPAEQVDGPDHILTTDVQELDDAGMPLIGKKSTDMRFYLNDPSLAGEFKEALKDARTGDTYPVMLQSQHEDHAHTHRLSILVKQIDKVILPPFDDDLVKKVTKGKTSSTEEFLNGLRADIQQYWNEQAERSVDNALANELVRRHEFEVPDTLVNGFLDAFIEDVKSQSRNKQLPHDFDEAAFRQENRAYAVWQAKWMLLKERIAEAEGIAVSDADIDALADADAAKTGISRERLLEYYKKSESTMERLLSGKIMTFLKSHSLITEKAVEKPEQQ
jgi:trigger factor